MSTIQDSISQIIELKGLDIFNDSTKFFAMLDDLSPEYQKERRMIKKFFDDELLALFVDDTKKVAKRLRLIKEQLEDFGFSDDRIYFILESFGIPLGWEQEIWDLKADSSSQISSYTNQPKKQNSADASVTDVALNDDFLKLFGFINKNLLPPVFNIPSPYRQPVSGITYRITKIDDEVFKGCDKLQSVVIPDTVTEIGKSAFEGCSLLEKVTIPNSVTKIGDRAFANCKLLSDIVLPNSLTDIGKSVFGGCSSLVSAVISNNLTKISEGLFGKCKSLVNVTIPMGVTKIEDLAFAGCESLNSLLIPKTVTKIGSRVFANCKSLESIMIPNDVVDVGSEAFGGCVKLQRFTLPTRFTIFKDDVNKQIDLGTKGNSSFKNVKVGDYIKFGNYPQTADGGSLPIEWQVLSKENGKMLVISRYGLDVKRFDSSSNVWKSSEIRYWLNVEFYNKAFNESEKKFIKSSNLSDVGTTDNVFLLSEGEAVKYFADDYARMCKATEYAVKNGAYVFDNGYSNWLLRSPIGSNRVRYFNSGRNSIDNYYVDYDSFLARLALWINL